MNPIINGLELNLRLCTYTIKLLQVFKRSGRIVNNPHIQWWLNCQPYQSVLVAMLIRPNLLSQIDREMVYQGSMAVRCMLMKHYDDSGSEEVKASVLALMYVWD